MAEHATCIGGKQGFWSVCKMLVSKSEEDLLENLGKWENNINM
jgi:hypothetical protein